MALRTQNLTKQFGGLVAVDDVSLSVDAGEIVGLIGPNGSGKSTFINCVSGVYEVSAGQVFFEDQDITDMQTARRAKRGLTRTFQIPHIFSELSVLQNVTVPLLTSDLSRSEIERRARERIELVELDHLLDQRAKELSGGQKKLLEFARILMLEPSMILLDEPFAGVHPELKEMMIDRISGRNADGVGFLLVSHDMDSIYSLSDRIAVLDQGQLIAAGDPESIQDDDRVVSAYLGTPTDD